MISTLLGFLGTAFIGVVGWTFQLGSRVSVLEARHEDLMTLINTQFNEVNRRLDRIERVMNGHMKEVD